MSTLRFTVYEILGYFAPGVIGLLTLVLIYWTSFASNDPISPETYTGTMCLCIGAFAAYGLGHVLQGISNYHPSAEDRAEKLGHYKHIVQAARKTLHSQCGASLDAHSVRDLIELAQAAVLNSGKTDMYDVLVYREGFYKGSYAGYAFLSMALLFRALRGVAMINLNGTLRLLTPAVFFSAAAFSAFIAFIFYQRYIRFAGHRIRYLLNVACFPVAEKQDKKAEPIATNSPSSEE